MGEAALKSHMKGGKHVKLMSQFMTTRAPSNPEGRNDSQTPAVVAVKLATAPIATKNDVLSAEVLWALKICSSHYSHKSSEASDALFCKNVS